MSDLIKRQAAIELAMQYCPDDDGTCSKADEDMRNLLDELENLPSAQPEIIACGQGELVQDGSRLVQDCIDRQAAIAEFSCCELTPDGGIDANYAIDFLKQMPSAQPTIEPKTGKWIPGREVSRSFFGPNDVQIDYEDWRCSACGCVVEQWWKPKYNFCPNCGADMRGEEDG